METESQTLKIAVPILSNNNSSNEPSAPKVEEKPKKKRGRKPKYPPESRVFQIKHGQVIISFD